MVSRAIAVRPVISVTPERLVVREGEAAQFSCKVKAGRPTPQVSLKKITLQFDLKKFPRHILKKNRENILQYYLIENVKEQGHVGQRCV